MFKFLPWMLPALVMLGSCKKESPQIEVKEMSSLPMTPIELQDLSGFMPVTGNWKITGRVFSDYTLNQDLALQEGSGVLVNQIMESGNENLFTSWKHGDLEISLEFMMPKGSNSGIYFQSRYEIQLFDSWKVDSPQHSDCGGIYERWKEAAAEGHQGYEGHAPSINASKAPGLWQHLYVKFKAPRFDAENNKVANASFEQVILNGKVLHENVELTGPTRGSAGEDEVAQAALMIQGDHGNVAFRNISYKRYFNQKVHLSQLNYQYYETGLSAALPDFDSLKMIAEGAADSFNIEKIARREDHYAIRFSGKVTAPVSGDYIFHTISDDGSKLYINDNLVVSNDFNHGMERKSGWTYLEAGEHDIRVDYYNNQWGKGLAVFYEGPEMAYQSLNSAYEAPNETNAEVLILEPESSPEMVRGFVNYQDEKRTHAISVGTLQGVHYSLDLKGGILLKGWRGGFADVTNMWRDRGHSQLVIPQSMAVEFCDGPLVAFMDNPEAPYVDSTGQFRFEEYQIDPQGNPVFHYSLSGAFIEDRFSTEGGEQLVRQLLIDPRDTMNLYCRLAAAEYIKLLNNGWYTIGGQYYLNLKSGPRPTIRESGPKAELLIPITDPSTINYALLW